MQLAKLKPLPISELPLPARGLFAALSKTEQEEFLKHFRIRSLPSGKHLVRAKERAESFFVVLKGSLEVSRSKSGKSMVLNHVSEGDVVGEISALGEMQRTADVICVTPCIVAEIPVAQFHEKLLEFPNFAAFIMKSLALRLSRSTDLLVGLATEDVPSRVLQVLRTLVSGSVLDGDDFQLVRERPSHIELARMVGTSREVVGRALRLLEQAGEIQQEGKQIFVRPL